MRVIGNVTAYYSKADYPSHHYLCEFWVKHMFFTSMEQMLMYSKAMHFGDTANANRIMGTNNCQAQKMIGRDVTPFDEADWDIKSEKVAFVGNIAKFRQNPPILALLMSTGNNILVEASERDTIWGVGLSEKDDRIGDPAKWLGRNKHGNVLMKVRNYFNENRHLIPEMDYTTMQQASRSRY